MMRIVSLGWILIVSAVPSRPAHAELEPMSLAGSAHGDQISVGQSDEARQAYIGIGFGKASNRYTPNSYSTTDSAYKVFAGYSFNKYVATELSYLNIRTEDGRSIGNVAELARQSLSGAVLGRLPFGDYFSVQGRIGYASYVTEDTYNGESSSKNDFTYGAIAAIDFGAHVGFRVEYEAVGLTRGVYDVVTLAAMFRF